MIKGLCRNAPANYDQSLNELSSKGLRVIAIARKEMGKQIDTEEREDIEKEMDFLGLIIFSNQERFFFILVKISPKPKFYSETDILILKKINRFFVKFVKKYFQKKNQKSNNYFGPSL